MSLDDVDNILNGVFAKLQMTSYRNDYEAQNSYETNLEKIKEARSILAGFSGARVTSTLHRCDDLERDWNKKYHAIPRTSAVSNAHTVGGEWIKELQAEDEIDEMEELSTQKTNKRKQKSKGKRQKGVAGVDLTDAKDTQRDTKNEKLGMERGTSLCHLVAPNSDMDLQEAYDETYTMKPSNRNRGTSPKRSTESPAGEGEGSSSQSDAPEAEVTIETHKYCLTSAIPSEVTAAPNVVVDPMVGTAFAELKFDTPLNIPAYEQGQIVYHVQMFRAVIAAVARGPPTRSPALSPRQAAATESNPAQNTSAAQDVEAEGDDMVLLSSDESSEGEGDAHDERRNHRVWKKMGSEDYVVLSDLSANVIAEYDAKREEEEAKADSGKLPSLIYGPLEFLRSVSTSTWVIVLCHGGYFAGAVYTNTKPILHKSFHRYVVRKKQGGKQSNHEKGGGSTNSAGGMIRKNQEIKWKVAVRDILCEWREAIDRAWVILYAAPGPDNRAILTDFAALPASTSNGRRDRSPIDMKDPRVQSVPMTTHRPTFKEVQRVFDTVSKCTIRVKAVNESQK